MKGILEVLFNDNSMLVIFLNTFQLRWPLIFNSFCRVVNLLQDVHSIVLFTILASIIYSQFPEVIKPDELIPIFGVSMTWFIFYQGHVG